MRRLSRSGRLILGLFDRAFAVIAGLAPSGHDVRSPEARSTFRAACRGGYERSGIPGLLLEGVRECLDLALTSVGVRCSWRLPAWNLIPGGVWRDLRLAVRSLQSGGMTTAIAAGTLAVGIGINAAVFSALDAVLWRQVPFSDAGRLVELWNFSSERQFMYRGFPPALIQQWRQQTDLIDRAEAYEQESFVYETGRGAEMVAGSVVTPGLFGVLGVPAAVGRTFAWTDGRDGTDTVAVVSDRFWRERLAGRDLDGVTITLNGDRYDVVGVMPATFRFPSGAEDIWTPYDVEHPPSGRRNRSWNLTLFGRLAPGVGVDAATKAVSERGERLALAAGWHPGLTASLIQPWTFADERTAQSLWVLTGAVGFLFLIVCATVANLTLSRSLTRARDFATCAAMGASPGALVRAAFFEQLLLAGLGAGAGVAVASWSLRVLVAALPDSMVTATLNAIDLDGRVLVFMAVAGIAAALLFGLPPALVASRTSITGALRHDSRTSTGSRAARRLRGGLAVVEVAVSVVLVVGAMLMTRSFVRLAAVDQGFDARGLISLRLGLPAAGYMDAGLRDRAASEITDRLAALPGVAAVTSGALPSETSLVLFGDAEFDTSPGTSTSVMVSIKEVRHNYLRVLQVPIVAGRDFRPDDAAGAVIVNEQFAARYFPERGAVGRRFRMKDHAWRTIIGVSGNTLANAERADRRVEVYVLPGQATEAFRPSQVASAIVDYRTILVRTRNPAAVIPQLSAAVHEHDPSIVIWKVALVEHLIADAIARPRVVFLLMAVFAGFGLILAMAGLYGVLSCLVAHRRQEMGIRLALGATTDGVRWLVWRNGLLLTATGLLIGLSASLPLQRAMAAVLYDVDGVDAIALAGAAFIIGATAAFACWWPARTAARVSPVELLSSR